MSKAQVETPNQGTEILTNVNTILQETLGNDETRPQLTQPCQMSKGIQTWTEIFDQKNYDRIMKMTEEKENKFEANLKK